MVKNLRIVDIIPGVVFHLMKIGVFYITTGNPHSYFDGTQRPGKNTPSNSIIAVDLNDKKII